MKKRTNKTAKILQQGGLMIEALAMLGLISVVTPTMYKKSAERTMEVEDINTASTVRTYLGAAESYVSNNYGTLMKDFKDGTKTSPWKIPLANLEQYFPYGFQTERGLYDYDTPEIAVVKNGTNLTAFALFPAKENVEIGQERTTRIASLIGSSGGYMPTADKARGVGGIWQLDKGEGGNWPFESNGRQYSLVVASSDVVSDLNGGVMDNDKYLQRTSEGSKDEEWRNTMRTDLYLGNHIGNETQNIDGHTGMNSIRDVKSMIIGAEKAATQIIDDVETESTNNGLYITGADGSDYADAYIGGALRAAGEQFVVRNAGTFNGETTARPQLVFGKNGTEYNFEVNEQGDITDAGFGGQLFNRFKEVAEGSNGNGFSIGDGAIQAIYNSGDKLSMHLGDDNTFKITTAAGERDDMAISMLGSTMNIYKDSTAQKKQRISMFHDMDASYIVNPDNADQALSSSSDSFGINDNGDDSLGNTIDLTYTNDNPHFGVDIGSNVRVQGVLTAGQVDTQHLRTASFSSGSEHIDDAEKWMKVDQYGIKFGSSRDDEVGNYAPLFMMHSWDSSENSDTAATGSYKGIRMASDGASYTPQLDATGGDAVLNLVSSRDTNDNYMAGSGTGAYAELRAGDTHLDINADDYEITLNVSGATNYNSPQIYGSGRVRQLGGNFDLDAANLNVTDKDNKPVFSVRGNDSTESQEGFERFNNPYTSGSSADYNVAAHGNVMFTSNEGEKINGTERGEIKYMSVGRYEPEAGVNIAATGKIGSEVAKNVLFVDQSEDKNSQKVTKYARKFGSGSTTSADGYVTDKDKIEAGTVYIRKGMIEVVPDSGASDQDAFTGTGVIQASRFVANNPEDSNGNSAYVPQVVGNAYDPYYGQAGVTRYDTYMVNPAYTSVMNDIKLTTRGGARLSDILPDFINKGIYVANNTYDEDTSLKFSGWGTHGNSTPSEKYASPYLGSIPAPQCPPGYGKVIAVHPVAFQMAQAGGLGYDDRRFMVQQDVVAPADQSRAAQEIGTISGALDNKYNPEYTNVTISKDSGGSITLSNEDGEKTYSVTGLNDGTFKLKQGESLAYVLSAASPNAAKPLMFQQSTYLKTNVVRLCKEKETSFGDDDCGTNYVSGWAALMGFIYPDKYYGKVLEHLTNKMEYATHSGTSWYWNIFPVTKGSLEAYATVYCYFDRTDMNNGAREIDKDYIEQYDYLQKNPQSNDPAKTYDKEGKHNSKEYRQRLNDPTLKYDELW